MIEILLLISLCRKIGIRAREKGLPEGRYKFFVVVAWFGGEIIGAVAAEIASQFLLDDQNGNDLLLTYLFAIFTASLFVWFVFKLVAIRPDIQQDDDFEDSEDDEPPRIQDNPPDNRGDDDRITHRRRDQIQ